MRIWGYALAVTLGLVVWSGGCGRNDEADEPYSGAIDGVSPLAARSVDVGILRDPRQYTPPAGAGGGNEAAERAARQTMQAAVNAVFELDFRRLLELVDTSETPVMASEAVQSELLLVGTNLGSLLSRAEERLTEPELQPFADVVNVMKARVTPEALLDLLDYTPIDATTVEVVPNMERVEAFQTELTSAMQPALAALEAQEPDVAAGPEDEEETQPDDGQADESLDPFATFPDEPADEPTPAEPDGTADDGTGDFGDPFAMDDGGFGPGPGPGGGLPGGMMMDPTAMMDIGMADGAAPEPLVVKLVGGDWVITQPAPVAEAAQAPAATQEELVQGLQLANQVINALYEVVDTTPAEVLADPDQLGPLVMSRLMPVIMQGMMQMPDMEAGPPEEGGEFTDIFGDAGFESSDSNEEDSAEANGEEAPPPSDDDYFGF